MKQIVMKVVVTTSNGSETTHTYRLGESGAVGDREVADFAEKMGRSGVYDWRDSNPSRVFMLSNPLVLYNGRYVVSLAQCLAEEEPPATEKDDSILPSIGERMGFLAV